MHPLLTARRLLLGGLAAFVGGAALAQPPEVAKQPPAAAQPVVKPADVRVGRTGELLVPLGGVVRFKPGPFEGGVTFTEVLTLNDTVVQVRPDADVNYIQLIGLAPGLTRITFTLTNGKKGEYEVLVQPDYDLLRKVIQKAVPTASIDVIPGVGSSIILGGYVNRPEDAETVMQIARAASAGGPASGAGGTTNIINAIQVGGLQHVQIEVVFASVNRTKLRQRGVNLTVNGSSASFVSNLLSPGANNISVGIVPSGIFLAMQALKTENLAKVLTEPKVVTQSGRPATIRSGGQQAVLGTSSGGLGSISVELHPVGTQMNVLPIVYGNGKIYLEVSPSVTAVDTSRGITTSAGFSTGFSDQSAQASVMLESGQTFAIAGLLETAQQSTAAKVPVIGEIPYVGALFSTSSITETESELIILVTPRLVDALDCAQLPKRPPGRETRGVDDYEFYLEGLLEAPRGQRAVWNGRCYQAAWKCDPLKAFPCKSNVCGADGGGHCGGGCNVPTALPAAPAPVVPAMPMAAPAPAASLPTAAPTEPIVMPQTAVMKPTPAQTSAPPVVLPESPVPGPAAPSEVPAPAPLAPSQGK